MLQTANQPARMPEVPASYSESPVLHRKCACGGGEDECESCKERREGRLQRAVAEPGGAHSIPPSVHEVLRAPGQPLNPSTRAFMEPRFGHDFSQVRIHTGARAADSAAAVHARAYTVGSHIVFGENEPTLGTSSGLRLLAHELVHVTQQQAFARQAIESDTIEMGAPGDSFEREAEARTEAILSGGTALPPLAQRPHHPRLSGAWESCGESKDCPKRDPGEVERGAKAALSVGELVAPESGEIVSGFAIGSSAASDLNKNPTWSAFASSIASSSDHWEILGFSDCEGGVELNGSLRDQRAQSVLGLLPASARSKIDRAQGAPLTDCVSANDSQSNRTFNRAVVFRRTSQTITIANADVIKGITCPPASATAVTDLADYIALLRCAEKAMGLGPREMLTVFRQIYYGKSWSVVPTSKWDNVITCSPAVGDPQPKLGANLFGALQASQEVAGVDAGHVFAGLEAMTCPTPDVSFFAGIAVVTMSNEDFATWGGDLGAAAAAHVACPQLGASAATEDDCGRKAGTLPFSFYYDVSAPPQDLEGDIDPFIMRANQLGIPCSGSSQKTFTPAKAMSDVFADTYLDPTSSLGKSHSNRYQCMLEILGATLSGKTVTNRAAIVPPIAARVFSFADGFYSKIRGFPIYSGIADRIQMRIDSTTATEQFITYLESKL